MDIDNLVHMANRIGEFFAAMPDRNEAKDGIVKHIRMYWEPRMRRSLLAHLDQGDLSGFSDLVREALREQRTSLLPETPLLPVR